MPHDLNDRPLHAQQRSFRPVRARSAPLPFAAELGSTCGHSKRARVSKMRHNIYLDPQLDSNLLNARLSDRSGHEPQANGVSS